MKVDNNFGPIFDQGINIPQNVVLPVEFIQAFAYMGLAEIKVTLAAIIQFMRIGGAEPITFSEFMTLTGLSSKASIQAGIDAAMKRGILTRYEVTGYRGHKSYVYEIQTSPLTENLIGTESVTIKPLVKLSVDVKDTNEVKTLTNLTTVNYEKAKNIKTELRKTGVFPNTANSLVSQFDLEHIEALLEIYPKAQILGLADSVGWLVRAIQNQWDITEIHDEIQSREQAQKQLAASHSELPSDLKDKILGFGWIGSMKEVLKIYKTNADFVISWVDYVTDSQKNFQNPAGIFRKGIRNIDPPPNLRQKNHQQDISWMNYSSIDISNDPEQEPFESTVTKVNPQDTIPETIHNAWERTQQTICNAANNPDLIRWGKKLIPYRYTKTPETLFISLDEYGGCEWLQNNMTNKFQETFRKHYKTGVYIIFEYHPTTIKEENYGTK